jgi:hypothetical protein
LQDVYNLSWPVLGYLSWVTSARSDARFARSGARFARNNTTKGKHDADASKYTEDCINNTKRHTSDDKLFRETLFFSETVLAVMLQKPSPELIAKTHIA